MLTIAQFAERTGIAASALRFYERKGLLLPSARQENGYRVYEVSQVGQAQLINSLRQADVSLEDIRLFLTQDAEGRAKLLEAWRRNASDRLLQLRMVRRYLEVVRPDGPQIHLQRWDAPSWICWLPATAPPRPLPFAQAHAVARRTLRRLGVNATAGGFARTLDWEGGRLIGEVGFRLATPVRRLPPEARLDAIPAMLFAMLECTVDDEKAAHRVFRFLDDFGFVPSGPSLERYLDGNTRRYQLLIGVRQADGAVPERC